LPSRIVRVCVVPPHTPGRVLGTVTVYVKIAPQGQFAGADRL
jgi:hypothetical protein